MIRQISAAIALTTFLLFPLASADEASTKIKGTNCLGSFNKFRCGYLGDVTVQQIYEKGWRVVAAIEIQNIVNLVIEEQH